MRITEEIARGVYENGEYSFLGEWNADVWREWQSHDDDQYKNCVGFTIYDALKEILEDMRSLVYSRKDTYSPEPGMAVAEHCVNIDPERFADNQAPFWFWIEVHTGLKKTEMLKFADSHPNGPSLNWK